MRIVVLVATIVAGLAGLASFQLVPGLNRRFPLEHRSRRPLGTPRRRRGGPPAELAQLESLAADALRHDPVALDELAGLLARSAGRTGAPPGVVGPDAATSPAGFVAALDRVEAATGLSAPPRPAAGAGVLGQPAHRRPFARPRRSIARHSP